MDKTTIVNELIAYIRSRWPGAQGVQDLPLDKTIFESGILDSFAVVELVAFVESRWAIQIADAEINSDVFGGISKISELVQRKVLASPVESA